MGALIILLQGSAASAQEQVRNDIRPGRYALNIEERPSQPYRSLLNYNTQLTQQGSGADFSVAVSRHHIIPYNVLRDFYNIVASAGRLRHISGFLNLYRRNVGQYATACIHHGVSAIDAADAAFAQASGLVRPGGNATLESFESFEVFYVWLPGNLFIGPVARSDDPGDGFEVNAGHIVGSDNFRVLRRLYDDMSAYIALPDPGGAEGRRLLNQISDNLSRLAAKQRPYKLGADNWLRGSDGTYRINPNSIATEQADVPVTACHQALKGFTASPFMIILGN